MKPGVVYILRSCYVTQMLVLSDRINVQTLYRCHDGSVQFVFSAVTPPPHVRPSVHFSAATMHAVCAPIPVCHADPL